MKDSLPYLDMQEIFSRQVRGPVGTFRAVPPLTGQPDLPSELTPLNPPLLIREGVWG